MALMNWNEHFVTGIEIVDSQHLGLVKMINDSAPILALAYARNPKHADRLLAQLTDYAIFHFKTEGDLIRQYQIDHRHSQHHFSAHQEFADSVANMGKLYQNGDGITGGTLLGFLANWLVFHILGEDQSLARQIHAIEAGATPAEAFERAERQPSDPSHEALTQALVDLYALMTEQNHKLLTTNQELQETREHLEELVSSRTRQLDQARREAESANQAKSAFIANLSHEIRTPMNAIIGQTWLLQEQTTDSAQKAKLTQVQSATQQLLSVINDLLDISSIESQQLVLEPLDFDIRQVIDHAISAVRPRAEQKNLRLQLIENTEIPALLRGDPVRIGQVVGNFLSNAIKFTSAGEIRLELTVTPGSGNKVRLRCNVHDQGIGIAPEALATLFDAFTQADSSTRRQHGGTGLGLAICKRLVDMMDGKIGVDSTPGEGSNFWFEIPLTASGRQNRSATSESHQPETHAASHDSDPERLREILERLARLLAQDDIQAVNLWRETNDFLRPALGQLGSRLEDELNNYNFEVALELTQAALDQY